MTGTTLTAEYDRRAAAALDAARTAPNDRARKDHLDTASVFAFKSEQSRR
jgi:hypothetical protein